jgi:hypothetical protein
MPAAVVTVARVHLFVAFLTGALARPLPRLALVSSAAEAVRDLHADSAAQRTRPDPRRQQVREFVGSNAWWVGIAWPALTAIGARRVGWLLSVGPAAVLAVVAVVAARVVQRVLWLVDQLDYRVLPRGRPTFESDAALLYHAWATSAGRRYHPSTRLLQPKSGYCGFAAIATMFRSCPGAKQLWIQYPR